MRIFVNMMLTGLLHHWQEFIFVLFAGSAMVQVFYYIFFFSRLAWYRPPFSNSTRKHPVSVIVCARNEAVNLARNIPHLLAQEYTGIHELVVVNDNSFDDSKNLLQTFAGSSTQLNVVELSLEGKSKRGKKHPLSIGINTARYDIVLLTDADCVPNSEEWIDKMQQTYDDATDVVLGYGAYQKKDGLLNKLVRWETFHTALQYLTYALAGVPYMGVGRNLSYRKSAFFRHKGFSAHEHVASGDDDLFINMAANKHNTRINITPEAFTVSEPPSTWSLWKKQKRRHYSTAKYYRPLHKILLGLYSLSHFLFYPLFALVAIFNAKWALLIFLCRLTVQVFVLFPAMKKLGERDLCWFFLFFDLWMFFYYFIFAGALIKKPAKTWK